MINDIPFDQWVEIPDPELAKKGKTQWVYRPSNYPGPIAKEATICPPGMMPRMWKNLKGKFNYAEHYKINDSQATWHFLGSLNKESREKINDDYERSKKAWDEHFR